MNKKPNTGLAGEANCNKLKAKLSIAFSGRDRDVHTVQEQRSKHVRESTKSENVEKHITKRTKIITGLVSYNVSITHNGKKYIKSYLSLEQARIFRNTILKHFDKKQ